MDTPKIVVIGSSYSSAAVFHYIEKYLSKSRNPLDILFVRDKGCFFFDGLLYEYLCNSCNLSDLGQEFRKVGFFRSGISCLETKVLEIDFKLKIVKTTSGDISYKYLVLAPEKDLVDSELNLTLTNSFRCTTPSDILKLKSHIINNFEKIATEEDLNKRKALLTFSVLVNNIEGIEIACSIHDLVSELIKKHYPEVNPSFLKVNLIEQNNVLSNIKDPFSKNYLFHFINKKGVKIYANSKHASIKNGQINIDSGQEIIAGTVIDGTLNKSSSLVKNLPLTKDGDLNVFVDLYLMAQGVEDVFVIGPAAKCVDLSDELVPSIKLLNEEAKICSYNIFAKENSISLKTLKPGIDIKCVSLGLRNSLVEIKNFYFTGLYGWIINRLVYIWYFLGWQKKIKCLINFLLHIFYLTDNTFLDVYEYKNSSEYELRMPKKKVNV